ncbi:MAG: hypothetical protein Q8R55_00700 [Candidatus Taylorbacteria bacterium]|nr:hypothetical protein [Candidatus Taylorbacteria bacterium]
MTPISSGEIDGVLRYLRDNASDSIVSTNITKTSRFLLESFGWPLSAGRKRAQLILDNLEKTRSILIFPDGGRGIKIKIAVPENHREFKPKPQLVKKAETAQPEIASTPSLKYSDKPWIQAPKLKKGVTRKNREAVDKGDRNEQRLHDLMLQLLEILKEKFPETILETSCYRSGRHNPGKGKVDLQDKAGEDVSPKLTVRDKEGRIISGRLIFDSKSSVKSARKFNAFIHFLPGQEGALLKRAIVVNKHRSGREISVEILRDLFSVGLISQDQVDKVLKLFGDI